MSISAHDRLTVHLLLTQFVIWRSTAAPVRLVRSWQVFEDEGVAQDFLVCSLDQETSAPAARSLRETAYLQVDIPRSMLVQDTPDEWVADRLGELFRRASLADIEPALRVSSALEASLERKLEAAIRRLQEPLDATPHQALRIAGAAARALALSSSPNPGLASLRQEAIQAAYQAASGDVAGYQEALKAIMRRLDTQAMTPAARGRIADRIWDFLPEASGLAWDDEADEGLLLQGARSEAAAEAGDAHSAQIRAETAVMVEG